MYSTQTACIHTVEYWVYCMWLVFCLGVLNGKTDKDKRKRFVGLTAVAACLCLLACSTEWVKTNLHCCAEHMHTFDRKENSPISEAMLLLLLTVVAVCCTGLIFVMLILWFVYDFNLNNVYNSVQRENNHKCSGFWQHFRRFNLYHSIIGSIHFWS